LSCVFGSGNEAGTLASSNGDGELIPDARVSGDMSNLPTRSAEWRSEEDPIARSGGELAGEKEGPATIDGHMPAPTPPTTFRTAATDDSSCLPVDANDD